METSNIANFWTLGKPGLIYQQVSFVDAEPLYAERILEQYGVHARISDTNYANDDNDCRIRLAKVPKQEMDAFMEAMAELARTVLLCGHREYVETCEGIDYAVRCHIAKQIGCQPEDLTRHVVRKGGGEAA